MVHLPNKTVKFVKSFNGFYYHKLQYNTNNNIDKTIVNHTFILIAEPAENFVHVMFAGVNSNINFAGVGNKNTNINETNPSELVGIPKDKPSKTLVKLIDNTTQAKKTGRIQQ
jgi:hypothetical protein